MVGIFIFKNANGSKTHNVISTMFMRKLNYNVQAEKERIKKIYREKGKTDQRTKKTKKRNGNTRKQVSRRRDAPLVGRATPGQTPLLCFLNKKLAHPRTCFYPLSARPLAQQGSRATTSEAQRSGADPARPLRRATAAIPCGASVPRRA